jgi:NADP-dependent 3-hydroxy acid dehydrogenase YdfG
VLTGRRTDRLEALARELDVEVHLAQLDVRDRAQVETVVATLPPRSRT